MDGKQWIAFAMPIFDPISTSTGRSGQPAADFVAEVLPLLADLRG